MRADEVSFPKIVSCILLVSSDESESTRLDFRVFSGSPLSKEKMSFLKTDADVACLAASDCAEYDGIFLSGDFLFCETSNVNK